MKRIPFDSLCLATAVREAQLLVGQKLASATMPNPTTLVLNFEGTSLLLSADPLFFRAHLVRWPGPGIKPAPRFANDVRTELGGSVLKKLSQRGLDRIVELEFEGTDSKKIVAELMGKHSNLMLCKSGAVVSAMKFVGKSKSVRPVLAGRPYIPPPFAPKPSLLTATAKDEPSMFEGWSPTISLLIESGKSIEDIKAAYNGVGLQPTKIDGAGAYPLDLKGIGVTGEPAASFSEALELTVGRLEAGELLHQARENLMARLKRVAEARRTALRGIEEGLDAARNARRLQTMGELLLAYAHTVQSGSKQFECADYEGNPLTIKLDPEKTAQENADRYFKKAKGAIQRADGMREQKERLELDLAEIVETMRSTSEASNEAEISAAKSRANEKRWLHREGPALPKEDRPFGGRRIKESLSPGGWKMLVGENAEANDYLTHRVARPGDLWFHVRGAPSAHVVLVTQNQADKVQRLDIEYAAIAAVRHSAAKHSGIVAVDFTQKRYVRKPRSAAAGTAVYTHEKTIHVEPKR